MREIRVSKMSQPEKVASSVLFCLEGWEDVEIISLGLSAIVLIKACALVNNLKCEEMNLVYVPSMDYIKDKFGETRSATKMTITRMK